MAGESCDERRPRGAAARAFVVTFSTRRIATAAGGKVSHVTVGTFLRGERVSPASRDAILAALLKLEASRRERIAETKFAESVVSALIG
jgi:hypothetical protein